MSIGLFNFFGLSVTQVDLDLDVVVVVRSRWWAAALFKKEKRKNAVPPCVPALHSLSTAVMRTRESACNSRQMRARRH